MQVVKFENNTFAIRQGWCKWFYKFLDCKDGHLWVGMPYVLNYCIFNTYEEAKARLYKYKALKTSLKRLKSTKVDYGKKIW